ncbi:putative fructose transport system kinase [Beutenbergia cavernae DSM 12333]|uniref:Putative fructose transport system kinase n=1 Tax=Beutenbergia cavernae (strain ATCC BAA-8 / DSM 12333 / CCUG 43141 / JCM 11478 / NBRC 16432 / NCIMB 13614 / HKI 0122) TaxID=471853 RepID=C5C309_BEUC1|nr:nucleoside/nucleotide kinase family protein [Beutenbergia cavernae]ACQ81853.1 putative fructose transport system kinase [Beutenbergia cavernae DSM 12333]
MTASLDALLERARALAARAAPRAVLGIVGAPGAGKSTLAAWLAARLGPTAVVVPMDGFHLANRQLAEQGLGDRKGAPDTFDAAGYVAMLQRIRRGDHVYAPTFERAIEEPVAGAIRVGGARLVITEGNYLLLDEGPWAGLRGLLDECWYLDVPESLRLARLLGRHEAFGRSPQEARSWAQEVDGRNAVLVERSRVRADLHVRLDPDAT